MTPLDLAYEAMAAAPDGDDAPRLRFYERLADGEMILLLEKEAEGETLAPRVFDLEDGPVVLVFDTEERLGAFTGMPAPYAALPGRVIAGLRDRGDMAIVLVEQFFDFAWDLGDRFLVMERGRAVLQGPKSDLARSDLHARLAGHASA